MSVRGKEGVLIIFGAVVVGLITCAVLYPHTLAVYLIMRPAALKARQLRVRLLCETDHRALLEAGREILKHVPQEYLASPDGRHLVGNLPLPEGVSIPQIIQDLGPRAIFVDYDGYLLIAMHGGMDHFGVRIYPEDFAKMHPNFRYRDRKLMDGLWYFDDGYTDAPADYDKVIDELLSSGDTMPLNGPPFYGVPGITDSDALVLRVRY